jgi:hypothetical protein
MWGTMEWSQRSTHLYEVYMRLWRFDTLRLYTACLWGRRKSWCSMSLYVIRPRHSGSVTEYAFMWGPYESIKKIHGVRLCMRWIWDHMERSYTRPLYVYSVYQTLWRGPYCTPAYGVYMRYYRRVIPYILVCVWGTMKSALLYGLYMRHYGRLIQYAKMWVLFQALWKGHEIRLYIVFMWGTMGSHTFRL